MKKSLFIILFLAVACGKAQKKGSSLHNSSVNMNEDDFRESLGDQRLQSPLEPVSDIQNTPPAPINEEKLNDSSAQNSKAPGVGVFTSITDSSNGRTKYSNCTGTLINENQVITANHCYPKDTRPEDFCSKMSFIHANEKQTFKCSKIVWSSSSIVGEIIKKNSPNDDAFADVLIIQLDAKPQNIQSFKISSVPADASNTYKILAYSPNEMDFPSFKSSKDLSDLKAHSFDYYFTSFKNCSLSDHYSAGYPFRSFNCPIIGGNSGAPVFNESNEIQGIVGGCVGSVDNDCLKGNKGGYMTDLSCLQKVNGSYQWKKDCLTSGPISSSAPLITREDQPKNSQ